MRCLFCKLPSADSKSIEHIIPESIGNTLHVLPKGVVCDKCNNYFARKIEEPFLNSAAIRTLRAQQGIPNKARRLVGLPGLMMREFPVTAYIPYSGMPILDIETAAGMSAILSTDSIEVLFANNQTPPSEHVVSRFLAKAGLETLALKGIEAGLSVEYLIDHPELDEVRAHARVGDPRIKWPYSIRRIYHMNKAWTDPDGIHQRVHEQEILITEKNEYYFVLAIFGLELALNLGGPEIEGYHRWLESHGGISPLYYGKNAHPDYGQDDSP